MFDMELGGGRSIQLSYADVLVMAHKALEACKQFLIITVADVLVMAHKALEACKQFLIITVQALCGKGQIDRANGS